MHKELREFRRFYEKLCKKLGVEVDEEHPFLEVMNELEGAYQKRDEQLNIERMEQARLNKVAYLQKVGSLNRYRQQNLLRTSQSKLINKPFFEKKRRELEEEFRDIMREDPNNAVARYRFGFYLMEEMKYGKAIQYFENALRTNEKRLCTYPLSEAQVIKAQMYIGFCGGQLLKMSLEKLNQEGQNYMDYETEGRSIGKVMLMLETGREQYQAIVNGEKQTILMSDYLRYKDKLDKNCLLISEVEGATFLQYGALKSKSISTSLSKMLHVIIHNGYHDGFITYKKIAEIFEPKIENDTIRTYVNRINNYCKLNDKKSIPPLFTIERLNPDVAGNNKVKLLMTNYIYVYRESEFIPLDLDEEE